jgi:hypothetical protein
MSLAAGVEFACHIGRGGRVVDEHRTPLHAMERAILADRHVANIGVIADAGKHEVGVLGGLSRRRRTLAAELDRPGFRLVGTAVVDGDVVAAAPGKMACHRKSHDPKTNPRCSLAHVSTLLMFAIQRRPMSLAVSRVTIHCDGASLDWY